DLLVAHPFRGQLRHPPLTRGERVEPGLERLARPRDRRGDLLVSALGKPDCPQALGEADASPEQLACLGPLVRATEHCAEVDEDACVLEPRFRARERLDSFPEELLSCLARFDQAEYPERGADGMRGSPAPWRG